jgi:hypothetical protein
LPHPSFGQWPTPSTVQGVGMHWQAPYAGLEPETVTHCSFGIGSPVDPLVLGQPHEKLDPHPSENVPHAPAGTPDGRLLQVFGVQHPFGPPDGG